uniref:Uncharacterized protein n=1 Tax=Florenciella sp. virus SA2 TaxID=3240092 RepID=A0AB39JEK6_9VIRU
MYFKKFNKQNIVIMLLVIVIIINTFYIFKKSSIFGYNKIIEGNEPAPEPEPDPEEEPEPEPEPEEDPEPEPETDDKSIFDEDKMLEFVNEPNFFRDKIEIDKKISCLISRVQDDADGKDDAEYCNDPKKIKDFSPFGFSQETNALKCETIDPKDPDVDAKKQLCSNQILKDIKEKTKEIEEELNDNYKNSGEVNDKLYNMMTSHFLDSI